MAMIAAGKRKSSPTRLLVTAWLPVLAWMGLIYFLSAQPDLPHPEGSVLDLVLSSAAHVAMFAILGFLAMRAFGKSRRGWLAALFLAVVYAILDEVHQAFVPGRTPDPWDVVCDVAGALLAVWAWSRLPIRWKRRLTP